ncbi:unnamed protein product [Amaranthus hypochondriacus]
MKTKAALDVYTKEPLTKDRIYGQYHTLLKFTPTYTEAAVNALSSASPLFGLLDPADVAAAIGKASNMSDEEREKRHELNFVHVTRHTAQQWAKTFELNDSVVEAQLRITQIRPVFPVESAVENFLNCSNRLLILGFNATLTEASDTPG